MQQREFPINEQAKIHKPEVPPCAEETEKQLMIGKRLTKHQLISKICALQNGFGEINCAQYPKRGNTPRILQPTPNNPHIITPEKGN